MGLDKGLLHQVGALDLAGQPTPQLQPGQHVEVMAEDFEELAKRSLIATLGSGDQCFDVVSCRAGHLPDLGQIQTAALLF